MKKQWFEIVRRTYGRYSWRLVEMRRGRRRVLARGGRDYRSKGKVRDVIDELRLTVPDAGVVDATGPGGYGPFQLPDTSFELVPGVFPLVVDDSFQFAPAVARRGRAGRDTPLDDRDRGRGRGDDRDGGDDHDRTDGRDRDRAEKAAEPGKSATRRRTAPRTPKAPASRAARSRSTA